MKARSLISKLSRLYPKRLTPWKEDRLGLFVTKLPDEIATVIVTLDADMEAVSLAKKEHADLIISHHPLLFPTKRVALSIPVVKQTFQELVQANLPLLCIHSNFDNAPQFGMNTTFAQLLKLVNVHQPVAGSFLFVGELNESISFQEFCQELKKTFHLEYILYQQGAAPLPLIKRIGFILGSATDEYPAALKANVDVFLSGDSKHHQRHEMKQNQLLFIELPHEIEEQIFLLAMHQVLHHLDPELKVILHHAQSPLKMI